MSRVRSSLSDAGGRLTRGGRPRGIWPGRFGWLAGTACFAIVVIAMACAAQPARPQAIDTRSDQCSSCRMVISDLSFAAQIVAPGEEPRFFDDLGCLSDYLAANALPGKSSVYVADHRTHSWIEASRAFFTSLPSAQSPMGSHFAAYADEPSWKADPNATAGTPVSVRDVLGPASAGVLAGQVKEGGNRP